MPLVSPWAGNLDGSSHPAAIRVDVGTLTARTLVPKVVKVYVFVTDFLQAGLLQCARLGFDLRCRGMLAEEAPTTPAENGCALETIILCLGVLQADYRELRLPTTRSLAQPLRHVSISS